MSFLKQFLGHQKNDRPGNTGVPRHHFRHLGARVLAALIAAITADATFWVGLVEVSDLHPDSRAAIRVLCIVAAALGSALAPRRSERAQIVSLVMSAAVLSVALAPFEGLAIKLFYRAPITLHFIGAWLAGPALFFAAAILVTTMVVRSFIVVSGVNDDEGASTG